MKKQRSKLLFLCLFGLPVLILYFIFCVYPIFTSVYQSFFSWSGFSPDMEFIGWRNYANILTDPIFLKAIRNDFLIVIGKEIVIVGMTVLFAISLTRLRFKRLEVGFFRYVFFIPNVLSVIVIATMWAFVFDPFCGLLNGLLKGIGLENLIPLEGWLVKYPLQSIVAVASWCGIGLFMIVLITAINGVSRELYESAQIDGAGEWMQLRKITLPIVWQQVKFIVVTILFQSLGGNFALVMPLTNGGVDGSSMVMGLYVYQYGIDSTSPQVGYSNAAAILLLIITAAVSLLVNHFMTRKDDLQ